MKPAALVFALLLSVSVFAQGPAPKQQQASDVSAECDEDAKKSATFDPVTCFVNRSLAFYRYCQLMSEMQLEAKRAGYGRSMEKKTGQRMFSCIGDGLASTGRIYGTASAATASNKTRNTMLKDYYAAWRTAVEGILPESGEVLIDYNRRQARTFTQVNERGERLKLE